MPRTRPRKRGEVHDLKILLSRALKKIKPKELNSILKKIVLYMTYGVDVSPLFPEVLMLSQTPDLLSKKMIYLFMGKYAESQPDMAMMALNTFVK
jgi:vesicle coat complex subunit